MKKELLYCSLFFILLYSCQSNQPSSEKAIDSLSSPVPSAAVMPQPVAGESSGEDSVLVLLDREKIVQRGLTTGAVIDVLTKEEEHLKTIADYEKVIAGIRGKDTIYLKDVATFRSVKK